VNKLSSTTIFYFILFLSLFISCFSFGQKPKKTPDDPNLKKIDIKSSDKIEQAPNLYNGNLVLSGKVKLFHRGATLLADTVILDQVKNMFFARSNVRLNVGDTVHLTSRKLDYDGNALLATAYENVVLKDRSQTIETDKLYYDRKSNTAYYNTRSKITRGTNIMFSNAGTYDLTTRSTHFQNDVNLDTKDQFIKSDDLTFYNAEGKAVFKGPSTITDKKNTKNYIYTEDGEYFTRTKEAFLHKNSRIYNDGKILSGEELYFNQKTGFGRGTGNVKIDDPKENRYLIADYGEVYQQKDSAFVRGRAYMVKAFKKDSLYISAELLTIARDKAKKSTLRGYKKARFYKSDIQGKCDSLVFRETIGQMHFYRKPIFWTGIRQITGDTIYAYLNTKSEKMDSIKVFQNAFAISKVDSLTLTDYQQIKGRHILGTFENEELNYVRVDGNAQSLVYVDDEDKKKKTKDRIGINRSDCGIIEADFVNKKVNIIGCRINAQAELYPESKLPQNQRYLKDFVWLSKERLNKWQDIFVDIPEGNPDDFRPSISNIGNSSKPKSEIKKEKKAKTDSKNSTNSTRTKSDTTRGNVIKSKGGLTSGQER